MPSDYIQHCCFLVTFIILIHPFSYSLAERHHYGYSDALIDLVKVVSNIGRYSLTGSLVTVIKLLSVGYETLVSSLFYYLYFSLSAHPSGWYSCSTTYFLWSHDWSWHHSFPLVDLPVTLTAIVVQSDPIRLTPSSQNN